MNDSDPKFSDLQSALAEVQRLRDENVRLRRFLRDHDIQIPLVPPTNGITVTTGARPSIHTPSSKAEQRIALLRRLFSGRDNVYAIPGRAPTGDPDTCPRPIVTGNRIYVPKKRIARRLIA